jgi:hypothetical protein
MKSQKEYQHEWYLKNRKRLLTKQKKVRTHEYNHNAYIKYKDRITEYNKKYYSEHRDQRLLAYKKWRKTESGRKSCNKNSSKWFKENPEKNKAYHIINEAIRTGKLKRLPCQICKSPKSHAHHDNYKKPLDVKWLCPQHHKDYHLEKTNANVSITD